MFLVSTNWKCWIGVLLVVEKRFARNVALVGKWKDSNENKR